MTLTLAEFLLARIAEDEEVARAAVSDYCDTDWRVQDGLGVVDQYDSVLVYREGDEQFPAHIARHDPARVLAECEAKRALVEYIRPGGDTECALATAGVVPAELAALARVTEGMVQDALNGVLRFLALPYADHTDYREEWRP